MPDTGAPYFIPYVEPTDLVRDYPDASEDLALAIVAALENIPVTEKRIEAFTGSGNWTVPAGVTYAIAHMLGGGGGIGNSTTAGNGGQSSVAFTGGTVTANGGERGQSASLDSNIAALDNTGQGGQGTFSGRVVRGGTSVFVAAGATVTPAEVIAVVVGAGGTAGTSGATGGSGYVYIEYYEEV